MAPITTLNSAEAHRPDITTLPYSEAVPDVLIGRATTVVTSELDGDAPVARVPWVSDDEAGFVDEGTVIDQGDPELGEVIVPSRKIAQLVAISSEQYAQGPTAQVLAESVQRSLTRKANSALLTEDTDGFKGLLNADGISAGGTISDSLDPLADLVGTIETAGGQPALILAAPDAWARLRKLKTGEGSSVSLLGAGTQDVEKRLLGIEVITDAAVPSGQLLVIDPTATCAAVGPVNIAVSEDAYFNADAVGIRATWRIGWATQRAERIGVLSVTEPGS